MSPKHPPPARHRSRTSRSTMCGIIGYTGGRQATPILIGGLRKLEYRGYDSAGVSVIDPAGDSRARVVRCRGKLSALEERLAKEPANGTVGIGHTRWATHGKPSDENAHPHRVDDVVLVHNGIIENFLELRAKLTQQGRKFESETDTEIIAHLVALASGSTLEQRVRRALEQVQGAYAIAVISSRDPNTIVVAKNASPLVIGIRDDAGLIA